MVEKNDTKSVKASFSRESSAKDGAVKIGSLQSLISSRQHDIWATFIIVFGVICALSVYFGASSSLGEGLSNFLGNAFGIFRYVLPPIMIVIGAWMIVHDFSDSEDKDRAKKSNVKNNAKNSIKKSSIKSRSEASQMNSSEQVNSNEFAISIFGAVLVLVATVGMLHITRGQPFLTPVEETEETLRSAGGVLGALVGIPLIAAMGAMASAVVLVGLWLLGLSITTRTTFRAWLKWITKWVANGCRYLRARPVKELPARELVAKESGVTLKTKTKATKNGSKSNTFSHLRQDLVGATFDPMLDGRNGLGGSKNSKSENLAKKLFAGSKKIFTELKEEQKENDGLVEVGGKDSDNGAKKLSFKKSKASNGKTDIPEFQSAQDVDEQWAGTSEKGAEKDDLAKNNLAKDFAAQAKPEPIKRKSSKWKLPSLNLLNHAPPQKKNNTVPVEHQSTALMTALESHGVEATLTGWVIGPTVTRYELELDEGEKVSSITKLSKDIAYSMAAKDVRILAPIPGRKAIGIEVPNQDRETVLLGDNLASKEAANAKHPLEVALGKDINGTTVMLNLAETPHILIAGATGAGKSSCLNTAISSMLMRSTPEQVRFILVDPKMVEMRQFENSPHLLTPPVVDPKKAANALGWAVREMDRRYETLFQAGFREMTSYNAALESGKLKQKDDLKEGEKPYEHMPFIVLVVDELSDLMMVAARDVEDYICRLAQKARAVGIHLIVATQRPSTDVITGVIKANIPARLAFSVSSLTDSRVILDQQGAERLVGQGDMLLRSPNSGTLLRIQGAWVSEEEVKNIVKFWGEQTAEPRHFLLQLLKLFLKRWK